MYFRSHINYRHNADKIMVQIMRHLHAFNDISVKKGRICCPYLSILSRQKTNDRPFSPEFSIIFLGQTSISAAILLRSAFS